jgi:probable addiction module antidote protein
MRPKRKQEIEIEKTHRNPLPSFHQALTQNWLDFLGTALAAYHKAVLEDEDEPRVLLIALRHLAQAQGIAKVAKAAGIERESLYRALSVHGTLGCPR